MATYKSGQFPYCVAKRRKQRFVQLEKVFDLSNKPYVSGTSNTKSWAAKDVLQAFDIRAGQTVLGAQVEILEPSSKTTTQKILIGITKFPGLYGGFDLGAGAYSGTTIQGYEAKQISWINNMDIEQKAANLPFWKPYRFNSKGTINLTMGAAFTSGRFRVVLHIMEEDR